MMHEPLLGVSPANALRGIAARIRQDVYPLVEMHSQMLFEIEVLEKPEKFIGGDRTQRERRYPTDDIEELRAIAQEFYDARIAAHLRTAERLEKLAAEARPMVVR